MFCVFNTFSLKMLFAQNIFIRNLLFAFNTYSMNKLFERHDSYMELVPMNYIREIIKDIDWDSRLIAIRGPKGVGKTTMILQYIKSHFEPDDRHVLYFSADTGYFSTHTLVDTADSFAKTGGKYLFIDEAHKYTGWSSEIKEIYDLHRDLHIVLSGSSMLQINDGDADLSRRIIYYDMPGLSMREFLKLDADIDIEAVSLEELLAHPNRFCSYVKSKCHPLEHFARYLRVGYYPFYFESPKSYATRLENVVNYTIDVELTKYRNLEVGNTRAVKALLQVISQMVPYDVDIAKLSRATGISRATALRYLKNLEEAKMIHRLFSDLNSITDLQKPDKILLDNTNLLYTLCSTTPEIGTVRETFLANQLSATGHKLEYAGYKSGDFRVDDSIVIEVGGADKGFRQLKGQENALVAADDIDSATPNKLPLWTFGFLY